MSSLYPPDGYSVLSGTWGTSMDRSESVLYKGPYSIEFKTGQTGTLITDAYPVLEGVPYRIFGAMRADSVGGGSTLRMRARWLDEDLVQVGSDEQVFGSISDAALGAVDTWFRSGGVLTAPAGARFLQIIFGKTGSGFTAWFGEVDFAEVPAHFKYSLSGTQSVATGITSFSALEFDTIDFEYGASLNTSTGEITIIEPGLWQINVTAQANALGDGKAARIDLFQSSSSIWEGPKVINGAAGGVNLNLAYSSPFSPTLLTARVAHDHGSNITFQDAVIVGHLIR